MGNKISTADREQIWIVMSEFFVDTEIDYEYNAEKLTEYPLPCLKKIFFEEVAPVCGPNMLNPAPSVWTEFDPCWVVSEIKNSLEQKNRRIYRFVNGLKVSYYRFRLNDSWRMIEQAIKRQKSELERR